MLRRRLRKGWRSADISVERLIDETFGGGLGIDDVDAYLIRIV
jgi:hypothetical protein